MRTLNQGRNAARRQGLDDPFEESRKQTKEPDDGTENPSATDSHESKT